MTPWPTSRWPGRPARDIDLRSAAHYSSAKLQIGTVVRIRDLQHDGSRWFLRFEEKGGKSRGAVVPECARAFVRSVAVAR